jgi:hypothetical protein
LVEDVEDFDDDSVVFDSNGYYSENGDSVVRRKEAKMTTNKIRRQVKVCCLLL